MSIFRLVAIAIPITAKAMTMYLWLPKTPDTRTSDTTQVAQNAAASKSIFMPQSASYKTRVSLPGLVRHAFELQHELQRDADVHRILADRAFLQRLLDMLPRH